MEVSKVYISIFIANESLVNPEYSTNDLSLESDRDRNIGNLYKISVRDIQLEYILCHPNRTISRDKTGVLGQGFRPLWGPPF